MDSFPKSLCSADLLILPPEEDLATLLIYASKSLQAVKDFNIIQKKKKKSHSQSLLSNRRLMDSKMNSKPHRVKTSLNLCHI